MRTLVLLTGLLANMAVAQTFTGYPLERLRFSSDRSAVLDVEFGRVINHLDFDIGLMAGYASNPLVLYKQNPRERLGAVVRDRVDGSVVGAVGFFDWIQVSLEIPVVLLQIAGPPIAGVSDTVFQSPRSSGVGDLRVIPKVRILKSEDIGIDVAVLASIYFPTGGGKSYFGDNSVIVTPELAISRAVGGLRLAGNISASLLRNTNQVVNLGLGQELTSRLGVSYRFRDGDAEAAPLELGASLASSTSLSKPYSNPNQQSLELKGQASWFFSQGLMAFIGGGVGLQPGWGTPDYRLYLGVRIGNSPADAKIAKASLDTDGDGIADATDKCRTEKENINGFEDADGCPDDPDTDGDGIADSKDKCPKQAEDKDGFEDSDGCLDLDNDADGIADADDKCPMEAEDKDGFEDSDGCPDLDNDKDGIVDASDECPMVKGVMEMRGCPDVDSDGDGVVDRLDNCPKEPGVAKNNGCKEKQLVVITSEKLQILDQVYFDVNKATIQARSNRLLNNVASVLIAHPEVKAVRIEGHTDSDGDDAKNLKLSQERCNAVEAYLVKKGVSGDRLTPIGFGETKPIGDNATKAGKAQNRRVEFNLGSSMPSDVKENK
jgi:outer membrane protein OmpA-like peptidoglycan-associated protein